MFRAEVVRVHLGVFGARLQPLCLPNTSSYWGVDLPVRAMISVIKGMFA